MTDPKCPEHCYCCCLNPVQHPNLCANIHHLFALLTALYNTCGGVIFLTAPEGISHGDIAFCRFEERLRQMLSAFHFPEGLVETCECDTTFWGVIVVKQFHQRLPYYIGKKALSFQIDVQRRLHCKYVTIGTTVLSESVETEESRRSRDTHSRTTAVDESNLSPDSGDAATYSSTTWVDVNELTWDLNKSSWHSILKPAKQSIDTCLTSCNIWKPSSPMRLTPNQESLRYIFQSDAECTGMVEEVKTDAPGFAIASRSWLSFLPVADIEARPASHVCDILTVTEDSDLCLWVVVSDSTEHVIATQLQYMLTVGRITKHQILTQDNLAPNLTVRCKLCSTKLATNEFIQTYTDYRMIQCIHEILYPKFHEKDNFGGLQQCIASLVLSKDTPIKTCVGHEMSLRLSAEQARTLLEKNKVTYISSPPGTGKTLCGITLYKEYGKQRSVYICPTQPLIQYLHYNGCEGTFVQTGKDLRSHIERGTFANKKCIVIDESHHLQWSRESWEELFMLLTQDDMFLFVFADNEFQSFRSRDSNEVARWIIDLSLRVVRKLPHVTTFHTMYRNTKKVVSFLQHAVKDMDVTYGNYMDGDGIHCTVMRNLLKNVPENSLAQYLRPLLVHSGLSPEAKYQVTDIAVLLDAGYTDGQIVDIRQILGSQLPGITTHASDKFLREGIVVDRIESFIGLDAGLCIFLLSPTLEHRIVEDPCYRVFLASRATHRAVFVVSKIDAAFAESMKFDRFQVSCVQYMKDT